MNVHVRISAETIGFGAPSGIDPHCIEVHVPAGNSGEISIVEHYGVAAGVFGRPAAERCMLSRKRWIAIRDDLKRHFNERLKEKQMTAGAWKTGINKVERLLGQELLVLCWGVEAAELEVIPTAVRNWLALRPEERWWLYAVTAAATGEAKHREVGWRKALRFALTENPVREALTRSEPAAPPPLVNGRSRKRVQDDPGAPRLPGFEEAASPFLMDAPARVGAHEEVNVATVLIEARPVADRASAADSENLSRGAKRARRRGKSDAHVSGVVLEGKKTSRSNKSVRNRRAPASNKRPRS